MPEFPKLTKPGLKNLIKRLNMDAEKAKSSGLSDARKQDIADKIKSIKDFVQSIVDSSPDDALAEPIMGWETDFSDLAKLLAQLDPAQKISRCRYDLSGCAVMTLDQCKDVGGDFDPTPGGVDCDGNAIAPPPPPPPTP
jgi:hypothetical protein